MKKKISHKDKVDISAIVITRNEEKKIEERIKDLNFAKEIIVIDSGSTDKTVEIAKKLGAKIYPFAKGNFQARRNKGAKEARHEWLLYVDADEKVTAALRGEIVSIVKSKSVEANQYSAYAIPRKNIILGSEMKHGGWWPDYVKRLIKRKSLIAWEGDLHEQPKYKGKLGYLKNPFIHFKHDNLSDMVKKTNEWSEVEAKLLYESGHPKMSWWRFIRIICTELWLRLVRQKGILDGQKGIIYGIYLGWSRFITYAKLWELQIESKQSLVNS